MSATQPSRPLPSDQIAERDAFHLLAGEPDLAWVTLDENLEVLTANAAAYHLYLPAERSGEDLGGRWLGSLLPTPFDDEIDRLTNLLRESGRSLLVRGIWRGHHVLTSVHPRPGGGVALLGRRSVPSPDDETPTNHLRVDAEVLELGELTILTPREIEVLALLGTGGTLKDAAAELRRSVKTVESHRDNIARKLGLSRRGELVRVVERSGLRRSDVGLARLILDEPHPRAASLGTASQMR